MKMDWFVCKSYGQSKFSAKTVQFGLNFCQNCQFRTELVARKSQSDLDADWIFLLFFLFSGDQNLTHRLWQYHGRNWKERTKPNSTRMETAADVTCVATGMVVAEVYVVVAEVYGEADVTCVAVVSVWQ